MTDEVGNALAQLRILLPGYREREGQIRMTKQVSRTFESNTQAFAAVEAGTGVGKTFGYLVPGVLAARRTGKRLIISTATVTLQDQLVNKDMAILARIFIGLRYAIAKGKNRYVCLLKLEHQTSGIQRELFAGEQAGKPSVHASTLFDLFRSGLWDGNRDTLTNPVSEREWKKVCVDSSTCMDDNCRHHGDCPHVSAKKRLENADVIVANHDIIMFACQNSFSRLLPSPEQSLVVFDEAHRIPAKAIQARQLSAMMQKAADIIKSSPEIIAMCTPDRSLAALAGNYADTAYADLRHLRRQIGNLFLAPRGLLKASNNALVFPFEGVGDLLSVSPEKMMARLNEINGIAIRARKIAESHSVDMRNRRADLLRLIQAERNFSTIASLTHEINEVVRAIDAFATNDGGNNVARWVETVFSVGKKDYQTVAAPIDASHVLGGVWKRIHAAVLTSATLAPYGDLNRTVRDFGLPRETDTLVIDSPFDYGRARMVVPQMRSDPRNHESHTREISKILPIILYSATKGSLVLFASARQMKDVAARMPKSIRTNVLMQGEKGRSEILRLHDERIAQGNRSVIFGLASFGEGVDFPGALCELVVIAKLPFAPPGDPYGVARENWIKAHGGNPFLEMHVPKTAITLRQQVGRLMRGENDGGSVIVLDPRLTNTSYGKLMMNGLPFKTFEKHLPSVAA